MKMKKIISIFGALLVFYCHSIVVLGGGDELEFVQGSNIKEEINEDNELFHNFQEMDYYMLLQSRVGCGVSLDYYSYGIYGNITKTPQDGEELYFKLNNMQLKSAVEPIEQAEVLGWQNFSLMEHVAGCSPDLKFCITNQAFYVSSTSDYIREIPFYQKMKRNYIMILKLQNILFVRRRKQVALLSWMRIEEIV